MVWSMKYGVWGNGGHHIGHKYTAHVQHNVHYVHTHMRAHTHIHTSTHPPSLTSGGSVGLSDVTELLVDPTDKVEYDRHIRVSSGYHVQQLVRERGALSSTGPACFRWMQAKWSPARERFSR